MSFRIYPVVPTEPQCSDYAVKVNGIPAELNTARVSAFPLNRRWPGHQREMDQSEPIQFLSMETDEPLHFEITPREPFDASGVRIRPRSLGITPEVTPDGRILFTLPRDAFCTVEPYGRSRALHIFADPVRDYGIDPSDENVLYYGPGEHDVGQIELHSNQTLYLDAGAVVYACIRAADAENIRILGRGILDNSRNKEQILFEVNAENNDTAVKNAKRRHTIQPEYCTGVEIDGITIRDSLVYNIRPLACRNFTVKNVKIIGCWRYNSDGIDMHNCENVHIDGCFLRTFDDSICVKGFDCYYAGDVEKAVREAMYRGGQCYDSFRNVLVENCVIWNDWGKALEIGAETRAEEISDVCFRNCDLIHLTANALDCDNVDYADVHDVTFSDIVIEADETIPPPMIQKNDAQKYENTNPDYIPCTISSRVIMHHEYSAGGTRRGKNRKLTFQNIRLYGKNPPRLEFRGYDEEHRTEDVLIRNLYWNDEPIPSLDACTVETNEFITDIRMDTDPFAEMKKNSVSSANQLRGKSPVTFENPAGDGLRVMFVGNSITRHGILPKIGWYRDCGMAASAKENDYVHRMMREILQTHENAAFCLCQAAEWERNYKNGREMLPLYEAAHRFDADVIVFRLIENCPAADFDSAAFTKELDALLSYLNPSGKAKILMSTGFWRHPGDGAIEAYAAQHALPLVRLGDLGEDDRMKAVGLYSHRGVANHPGDEGMKQIAERLMHALAEFL